MLGLIKLGLSMSVFEVTKRAESEWIDMLIDLMPTILLIKHL